MSCAVRVEVLKGWGGLRGAFRAVLGTCVKKLVTVRVAGLKLVRLHDSSPLAVLSRERRPTMLEFLLSDHEPFLSERSRGAYPEFKTTDTTRSKVIVYQEEGGGVT